LLLPLSGRVTVAARLPIRAACGQGFFCLVDACCEPVALLDEEFAQFGVVDDPAGPGELVPGVCSAAAPVLADRLGLAGLGRAGCEATGRRHILRGVRLLV
jgi:hypothetical protein